MTRVNFGTFDNQESDDRTQLTPKPGATPESIVQYLGEVGPFVEGMDADGDGEVTLLDAIYLGQIESGLRTPEGDPTPPPEEDPTTGIETLVNTYTPPTNVQVQAAGQRTRAGEVSTPAQNLANQQANAFSQLLINAGVIPEPPPEEDEEETGGGGGGGGGGGTTTGWWTAYGYDSEAAAIASGLFYFEPGVGWVRLPPTEIPDPPIGPNNPLDPGIAYSTAEPSNIDTGFGISQVANQLPSLNIFDQGRAVFSEQPSPLNLFDQGRAVFSEQPAQQLMTQPVQQLMLEQPTGLDTLLPQKPTTFNR